MRQPTGPLHRFRMLGFFGMVVVNCNTPAATKDSSVIPAPDASHPTETPRETTSEQPLQPSSTPSEAVASWMKWKLPSRATYTDRILLEGEGPLTNTIDQQSSMETTVGDVRRYTLAATDTEPGHLTEHHTALKELGPFGVRILSEMSDAGDGVPATQDYNPPLVELPPELVEGRTWTFQRPGGEPKAKTIHMGSPFCKDGFRVVTTRPSANSKDSRKTDHYCLDIGWVGDDSFGKTPDGKKVWGWTFGYTVDGVKRSEPRLADRFPEGGPPE